MQTIIVNRNIPLSPDVRACSGTAPDHVKRYAAADIRTFDVPLTELALHRNSIFLHADVFNSPCCIGVIFCRQTRMVLPLPFPSRPRKAKFSALPTSFLYKKRLFPAAGSNHGYDYTAAPHALPLPEYGGTAPCPSLRRSYGTPRKTPFLCRWRTFISSASSKRCFYDTAVLQFIRSTGAHDINDFISRPPGMSPRNTTILTERHHLNAEGEHRPARA